MPHVGDRKGLDYFLTRSHKVLPEERKHKLSGQRQKVWLETGEDLGEARGIGREVKKGASAHDAMWVVAQDIVLVRVQVHRFDQFDGEVVPHVFPYDPFPEEGHSPPTLLRRLSVIQIPGIYVVSQTDRGGCFKFNLFFSPLYTAVTHYR